jgi:hypothetical protein
MVKADSLFVPASNHPKVSFMKIVILINDAPYGTEKAYNALRLGMALQKDNPNVELPSF